MPNMKNPRYLGVHVGNASPVRAPRDILGAAASFLLGVALGMGAAAWALWGAR